MQDWSLADLQRWLQSAIQNPAEDTAAHESPDGGAGSTISQRIAPSQSLTPQQRLRIYQQAYFARLLDCLKSEFPAVRCAAGDDAFGGFAIGYLQACPSRSDSLADLGTGFADYLSATRPPRDAASAAPDFADLLIDLARLEQTYNEVFDGPGPEQTPGLTPETLAGLSAEEFAGSHLRFHGSVRLLTMQFPCHEFASAVRKNQHPQLPEPSSTSLVVFRRDYVVRRFPVTPVQWELLTQLRDGATIGEALAQAARNVTDLDHLAADVQSWFAQWARAPLFQDLVR